MKRFALFLFFVCCFSILGGVIQADSTKIDAKLVSLAATYAKQEPVQLLLQLDVPAQTHIYWKNPGEVGLATSFEWHLPQGWSLSQVEWPTPELFVEEDIRSYGYQGAVPFLVTLIPPVDGTDGSYPIEVEVQALLCGTSCVPEKIQASVDLKLGTKTIQDEQERRIVESIIALLPTPVIPRQMTFLTHKVAIEIARVPNLRKILSIQFFPEDSIWAEVAKALSYTIRWDTIELELPLPASQDKKMIQEMPFRGILKISYQTKQGMLQEASYLLQSDTSSKVDSSSSPSYVQGLMEPFAKKSIWDFVLLGFIGGLILNVMPCVLPVIGLKVVHILSSHHLSYKKSLLSAFMYSLGIVVAFWALVGVLFFLQRVNEAYGWGFQLQNPYFLAFLIILFVTISANLFGFFGFGYGFAAWAQEKEERIKTVEQHAYLRPFLSGLLATCVATPCTGPLLGAVIGFASLLSLPKAALLFTSIAVGMASPFILIALIPPLSWILPKPGAWMVSFKQCMGFLLLLSALWFIWVLSQIAPHFSYDLLLLGALGLFFSLWLFGKSQQHREAFLGKLSFLLFLITFVLGSMSVVASFQMRLRNEMKRMIWGSELVWERYSEERLLQEVAVGRTVLVNGSAKWCLTCQANEIVFSNVSLKKYLEDKNVVLMNADWTKQNSEVTEWLHSLGRNGVPTIAIYKKGKEPIILPELISPEIVKSGIQ